MALYVTLNTTVGRVTVGPVHLAGGTYLYKQIPPEAETAFSVVEVQADSHELLAIKSQLTGLPSSENRVVKYRGDFAEFIYWNLIL
jgi:hypothetical protein